MSTRTLRLSLMLLFFVSSLSSLSAGNISPGSVDLSKIEEASPQLQKKLQDLRTTRERARRELGRMREELQKELKAIKNNQDKYSSDKMKSRKVTLQRKFQTLRRRRSRLNRFFSDRKERIENQFRAYLQEKIDQTARQRGINVVFNQINDDTDHSILWVAPERDLTEDLLKEVRSGNPFSNSSR